MSAELQKIADEVMESATKSFVEKVAPRAALLGVAIVYIDNDTKATGYNITMPGFATNASTVADAEAVRRRLLLEALRVIAIEVETPRTGSVN